MIDCSLNAMIYLHVVDGSRLIISGLRLTEGSLQLIGVHCVQHELRPTRIHWESLSLIPRISSESPNCQAAATFNSNTLHREIIVGIY